MGKQTTLDKQPFTTCTNVRAGDERKCGTIFRPPTAADKFCISCRGEKAKVRARKSYGNEAVIARMDGGKFPYSGTKTKTPKYLFGRLKETK